MHDHRILADAQKTQQATVQRHCLRGRRLARDELSLILLILQQTPPAPSVSVWLQNWQKLDAVSVHDYGLKLDDESAHDAMV